MLIKIEVYHDGDIWCARGTKYDIFTCAKSLDNLVKGIQEATCCHFEKEIQSGKQIQILIHTKVDAHRITKTTPAKR
jgi:hypothetical protein